MTFSQVYWIFWEALGYTIAEGGILLHLSLLGILVCCFALGFITALLFVRRENYYRPDLKKTMDSL